MDSQILLDADESVNRLTAALAYATAGWPVFPCQWRGPQRKKPLPRYGYCDATIKLSVITGWWSRWPDALIGTPTGKNFVVLDVDPRHGGDETLVALGGAPATPTALTASGGRH